MFFWNKKKPQEKKEDRFNSEAFTINKEFKVGEPETLAKLRLESGAKDYGYTRGKARYDDHKTKVNNQWVNPLQSINSGFGNSQLSLYNYQNVNYYECYALAQGPLFNKIFDLLSKTPFMNGGDLLIEMTEERKDELDKAFDKYGIFDKLEAAVRSSFVSGGCLIYMDFGLDDLEKPLDLKKMNMKQFKGFRHIDPINVVAVDVNTVNPATPDYMNPDMWYIIGLGNVHKSHLLKFEDNVPEKIMRPLCMYFGMPLTLLIKQDVANSNLASQGLANLLNRFRYLYLKTGSENFTGAGAMNFRARLEAMSMVQDNFSIYPLKDTEEIQQFTTSVSGMAENAEFFYQIIAAKTDITLSVLMGKGASGLSGTLEGERKNFYDRIRRIQQHVKSHLLTMCGIVAGKIGDGKFVDYPDYIFNPLEQSDEKEKAENLRSYVEVARSMIEMGAKPEDMLNWLKSFKDFKLDHIDFDTETEGLEEYDIADIAESQGVDIFNENPNHDEKGRFSSGPKKSSDVRGKEHKGVKGQKAVEKLLQEKNGYVKGAFKREDIGGIDLLWGNDRMGLEHIIKRRKETGQDLDSILDSLTNIIEKGSLRIGKNKRWNIQLDDKMAIIKPELDGEEINFVLTAFEMEDKK